MAYKQYKMKGHTLPGIKQRSKKQSPFKRKITEKHKELANEVKDFHEQGGGFGAHGWEPKWETRQRARNLAGKGWKNKRGIGGVSGSAMDDAWGEVRAVKSWKKHTGNPI